MSPRASIFAKLTLAAMAAAAASVLAIAVFVFEVFEEAREHHAARLRSIGRLAIESMLVDPAPAELARLADELDIEIRYRDEGGEFATDPQMPAFSDLRRHKPRHKRFRRLWRDNDNHGDRDDDDDHDDDDDDDHERGEHSERRQGFWRANVRPAQRDGDENFYLLYRRGEGSAIVGVPHGDVWDRWPGLVAALGLALAAVWGAAYFCIRRLLAPLTDLRAGMEAVGAGEWREFKSERKDEIGALGRGFNRMQARLRKIIAARERFLIDASHELRSPIARLKLATEFIENGKTRARVADDLRELESLADGILQNAKARSKHSGIDPAPLDVAKWCEQARARRPQYERARLDLRFDSGALFARADGRALARALDNVWDNALKHASRARTTAARAGAFVEIAIEDDGPGAAAADLPRLFEPFFRADRSRARDSGGFGLGLAIADGVVKAHGGETRAENIDGGGLRVVLRLPAAEPPPAARDDSVK